jgi:proteasome accessory factor B
MSEKVERLVNLTVALLETRRPVTFAELRDRTGYYGQADAESARRMFERDKDELRSLGVPIETRERGILDAELGYTIDRAAYELPDIDLSPDEVAALALALRVAGGRGERLAAGKVAALAPDPSDLAVELPARFDVGVDPVDRVADAIVERRAVTFRYRRADGDASDRTVDPYAVAGRRGSWYVVGRDHDRDDLRAFRLDRVEGRIAPTGEPGAFEPPEDLDLDAHLRGPGGEVDATVAVHPEVAWDAALRGGAPTGEVHDGWAVHRFAGTNPWALATWATGQGDRVEVLSPPEVRDDVVARLRRLAGVSA